PRSSPAGDARCDRGWDRNRAGRRSPAHVPAARDDRPLAGSRRIRFILAVAARESARRECKANSGVGSRGPIRGFGSHGGIACPRRRRARGRPLGAWPARPSRGAAPARRARHHPAPARGRPDSRRCDDRRGPYRRGRAVRGADADRPGGDRCAGGNASFGAEGLAAVQVGRRRIRGRRSFATLRASLTLFTGIVTDIGEVLAVTPRAEGLRRLIVGCSYDRASIALGASIACAGVCLSVMETGERNGRTRFAVDAAAETLAVTTAGTRRVGTRINREGALKTGDELGGHLVSGHVDGLARVLARDDLADMVRFTLTAPTALARFIAPKGSVALDGVSLTVNQVEGDTFGVLIIPHTLDVTTLGANREGARLNLEVDQMARYVARLLEADRAP